ncbi:M57 family metalloprotease [Aquimarina brevivitae]|uniref:Dual-action HEIGH metallo-peptidase n=1 Tax=Aquimarina brevivitae TaxID=323412 RepID=A0A4Q7NUK1_9FLAO|nr:M57 family metalloprotease [Aquimarina brevivitae]RZS90610.1 dual-action HEIGH metallo-peptidase [Aquimarina brevivitae]
MKKISLLVFVITLFSCSTDHYDDDILTEANTDLIKILEENDIDPQKVVITDEYVILEGDIGIPISAILEDARAGKGNISKQALRDKSTFEGGRVSNEYNNRIRIAMAADMRPDWMEALRQAINRFNEINECRIHYTYVTGSAHTYISYKNLNGTIGFGEWPQKTIHSNLKTYRKPGSKIHIHPNQKNQSLNLKIELLLHEMGHTLGFEHTFKDANHRAQYSSNYDGDHISGTPIYDPLSVMAPAIAHDNGQFSYYDKIALQKVYVGPFINDFEHTISGTNYADVFSYVTYTTNVINSSYNYKWEYKYPNSSSWGRLPNSSSSNTTVRFKMTSYLAPHRTNTFRVRCTITKPNGDVSRDHFSTRVDGIDIHH